MLVFLVCAAAVVYILAGYPLLLGWLSRRRGRPVQKGDELKPVTIVMAVYNGGQFIAAKLESILALNYPRELLQVLVVSDGSTDETDAVAASCVDRGVDLLRVTHAGKHADLNAAIARATGDILVFTDVRQRLDRDSVRRLVECFSDPSVGVAS